MHQYQYCRKPSIKIRIVTYYSASAGSGTHRIAENHLLK